MSFKLQDRVYYVSDRHSLGRSNPLKGSEYECVGVVTSLPPTGTDPDYISMSVNWDNGTSNAYSESDLESIEERLQNNDPNVIFRRK